MRREQCRSPAGRRVLAAVTELAERLPARSAEIERAGRLPADVVATLRQARVFGLWMPRELGGLEAEPATVLRVVETLAAADGSTGWCVATGLASNCVGAFVPEEGARRLYPTGLELAGGALMPGGRATPQPDGSYLVRGRWSFGSGVQHCDWVVGGAIVTDGSGPAAVLAPPGTAGRPGGGDAGGRGRVLRQLGRDRAAGHRQRRLRRRRHPGAARAHPGAGPPRAVAGRADVADPVAVAAVPGTGRRAVGPGPAGGR